LSSLTNPVRNRTRRRRSKDSISDTAFRIKYLRRSRGIYNRYLESKPWIKQLYKSFLNIKAGQRVVDVGCGTGDFTRFLAIIPDGKAKILGVDSNEKSIKAAIADTKKTGLSRTVSYRVGDVYKLPLEDRYADLTCCRTLLMHLPDPVKAVTEMVRVTKIGGSVVAIEPGGMTGFYDPNDEAYVKLGRQASNAWHEGIKKLEGKEYRIGEKLPGIFQKAGLSEIKAEIQADAWLYSDPRRKLRDVKDELRFDYSMFKDRHRKDRKYLTAGGMSSSKITYYFNRMESRTKKLLSDDQKLRKDPSLYGATFFLVSGKRDW
jgi:ubiquinone/menaquinone biosynthesis C-methylase UbiE